MNNALNIDKFMGHTLQVKEMKKYSYSGRMIGDIEYYPIYIDSARCKLVIFKRDNDIYQMNYTFDGYMSKSFYAATLYELERKIRYEISEQNVHHYIDTMAKVKYEGCEFSGIET